VACTRSYSLCLCLVLNASFSHMLEVSARDVSYNFSRGPSAYFVPYSPDRKMSLKEPRPLSISSTYPSPAPHLSCPLPSF
jgi:hypothetical protein